MYQTVSGKLDREQVVWSALHVKPWPQCQTTGNEKNPRLMNIHESQIMSCIEGTDSRASRTTNYDFR